MARLTRRSALGALALGALGTAGAYAGASLFEPHDAIARRTHRVVSQPGDPPNRIQEENLRPGDTGWRMGAHGTRLADDVAMQIKGYASSASVAPGEVLRLHTHATTGGTYRIELYRLGYYHGAGARLIATSPELPARRQPAPLVTAETGMISCSWPPSWEVLVGPDWCSGVYLAVFTTANGWRSYTLFVVRDDATKGGLCVLLPFATYQAYNIFPADRHLGRNLYRGFHPAGTSSPQAIAKRSREVSFDRPYPRAGLPFRFEADQNFVQWLERVGYDVSYASNLDLHSGHVEVTDHSGLIFIGHDEYWSWPMRRSVEFALSRGTSLAFMSSNNVYWHIRVKPGPDGAPNRVVVCYREQDPSPNEHGPTGKWRWLAGGQLAEQGLLGVQFNGLVPKPAPYRVSSSEHWFWAGTGLQHGDVIDGLVGVEADGFSRDAPRPGDADQSLLSHSPYRNTYGEQVVQNTSIYETPDGAVVFVAATMLWTTFVADAHRSDPRIEVATGNLLDRIGWIHHQRRPR